MKVLLRWGALPWLLLPLLLGPGLGQSTFGLAADGPAAVDAQAQTTSNSGTAQTSTSNDDAWHFDLGPYVWFPGVSGTVGAGGHYASVHVTGADVLSNFTGGIAGYVVVRKNRFVMPIDFMWARLATTQGIPINEIGQYDVRAELNQVLFTPKAGYRIIDGKHFKVDALVGLRYWHEGPSLTFRPSQFNLSKSANWADGVAGGDFHFFFTPKVWITASGDAGGGGAALDYQAFGMLNFQPKPLFGFFVGWRYLDVNYTQNKSAFVYDVAQSGPLAGLNMQLGGKPPIPPSASCSISPQEVWAGEPVTATLTTANFNPKHTLTYSWNSNAKVSGANTTGNVDTTGLAPGMYTVTGTAKDAKEKKNNTASCNASFTVKQPHPPTATCSASPDSVKAGENATITANATNPDNFPLTYAWSSTAGHIGGSGATATLETAGASEGSTITATATVTDSRGLSTTCNAAVNIQLPPPVTVNEVSEVGECKFMDAKRPWRVDNTCKAILDDVAMRIQREPSGKFVVVGYTDEEETIKASQLGAQRAVNMKYYLVNGEGGSQIDASRVEVRTSGTVKEKGAKVYFVPAGATFSEESVVVDESQVKGQPRNAPVSKTKKK